MIDKLFFVDVETTGLDPSLHEIIEIGAITVDPLTLNPINMYETKVAPTNMDVADERALVLNKFSYLEWLHSKPFTELASQFVNMTTANTIVCGHNIGFDIAFIDSMFQRFTPELRFAYKGYIDTQGLAKKLNISSPSYKLGTLCRRFDIYIEDAHSAMPDIEANLSLFKAMKKQYKFRLEDIIVEGPARGSNYSRNKVKKIVS